MKIKLTLLMLFTITCSIATVSVAQTVNLTLKNSTLENVFSEIKKQTGYRFIYKNGLLNNRKKVNLTLNKQPLKAALDDVLKNENLAYQIYDKTVVIRVKEPNEPAVFNVKTIPQKKEIKGTVTDKYGEPINGATIREKGTQNTTYTNKDGQFTLTVTTSTGILVFSNVGYLTKEISLQDGPITTIILEQDVTGLEEAVVVAFGQQKKLAVTGSIATVTTKELKQSAVSNLSNALVGRLPGLFARQSSGEPGAEGSAIWLRGISSFSSGSSPVILVDGVRRDGFQYIDPNEVETISILKDAASTSVFGVEGANGIIVVTTKRGKASLRPSVTTNVEQAINQPTYVPKFLGSAEYFRLRKIGLLNDGKDSEANTLTDEFISRYDPKNQTDESLMWKYLYPDVNWYNELVKPHSLRMTANVNVNGGTEKFRYFVSGSFMNNGGIYKNPNPNATWNTQAKENRYNFRSNIDLDVNDWIKTELGLASIVANLDYPGEGASTIWNSIFRSVSYRYPMVNPDGTVAESNQNVDNSPYALLTERGFSKQYRAYLQGTVGVTFKLDFLLEGLSLKNRFSYDNNSTTGYSRTRNYFSFRYNGPDQPIDKQYSPIRTGNDFLGYSESRATQTRNLTNELYINYTKKIADHSIDFMSLYRIQNNGVAADNAVGALPFRTQSWINRLDYAYKNRYFLQGVLTYSGAENFAQGKRFGLFPAASAGWVISNEPFMSDNKEWLDLLKLRFSAGKVGIQGDTRFAYQSQWNLDSGKGYTFGDNYSRGYQSAEPSREGNPDVSWETEINYNLGLDFSIFKGKLDITTELFHRKRSGIFFTSEYITPAMYGIPTSVLPRINAGVVQNRGFEITAKHTSVLFDQFRFNAGIQWSFARNKILDYVQPPFPDRPWQQAKGTRINEHYGYTFVDFFQNADDVTSYPAQFGKLQPGDLRYIDKNNDGRINDLDRGYLGKTATPEHIVGFNLGVNYKGLDVSVLFQAALGRYMDLRSDALFGREWLFEQLNAIWKDNYWTPERPNAMLPRLTTDKSENNVTQFSDFWLRDASYLRLKNFEIGYSFSPKLLQRIRLQNVRIYANGNNLLTWDKMQGLFDPEVNSGTGATNYPIMRTFNFGIQLGLQ